MLHVTDILHGEYLMKEALVELGGFKIGGISINKVRFANDTAIKAKTQKELQDMFDIERKNDMKINIER